MLRRHHDVKNHCIYNIMIMLSKSVVWDIFLSGKNQLGLKSIQKAETNKGKLKKKMQLELEKNNINW